MQSRRRAPLEALVLSGALLGGAALSGACQSAAPPESKEPATSKPAASAPAAVPSPTAPSAAATSAVQAAQPLKAEPTTAPAKLEEPSAGAGEPAAKLAAGTPPSGVPAADAPKKGDGKTADKPAAAPAGKETQGAVVSEEAFSTWLQAATPAKSGGPVQLEAVLVAKPPYHVNAEYPHKFKLNPAPAGISYPEDTARGMKVTPERGVLAIPANAQSAGKPAVSGTLSFSVCTAERCMVEKRDLSVALEVM